jgi:hypothetical protein
MRHHPLREGVRFLEADLPDDKMKQQQEMMGL